jgi:hypothetical protein
MNLKEHVFCWALTILFGLNCPPARATNGSQSCTQIESKYIPAELKRLDCNSREIARIVLEQKEVVPTKLYHFGERKYLDENIAARTIPEKAWHEHVMGEGRYGLNPLRRGLYGTASLDTNDFYSDYMHNALMEIHISPECTLPEHVVTLIHLPQDPKFAKWFLNAKEIPFLTLTAFEEACFEQDGSPKNMKMIRGGWESICEKIVTRFLDEASIKVVHDHEIQKSFYIRDRACIKTVLGTPEELLHLFASQIHLWLNSCHEDTLKMSEKTKSLFAVLTDALGNYDKPVPAATIDQLKQNVSLLKEAEDSAGLKKKMTDIIDAHVRCQGQHQLGLFRESTEETWGFSSGHENFTKLCANASSLFFDRKVASFRSRL